MAIGIRTPPAEQSKAAAGTIAVNLPTGSASGDVTYIKIYGLSATVDAITAPVDWSLVSRTSSLGIGQAWYRKVLTGADTTATFTLATGASGSTKFRSIGFTGVDNTTPEDNTYGQTWVSGTASVFTAPTVMALTSGAVALVDVVTGGTAGATASASGFTAQADSANIHLLTKTLSTYGATGTVSVTLSAVPGASQVTSAGQLVLRPSGGIQYTPPPSSATVPAQGYSGGRHILINGAWLPERRLPVSARQSSGWGGVNALSRCKHPQNLSDGSYTDYTSHNYHKVLTACTDLTFEFGNYHGSELPGSEDVTYRVGLEVTHPTTPMDQATSKYYPLFFGGKRDGVCAPGGRIRTDALSVDLAAGTVVYTRVRATTAAGVLPLGGIPDTTLGEGVLIGAGSDLTTSGSIPNGYTLFGGGTPTTYGQRKVAPVAMRATPLTRAFVPFVALIGDSIIDGVLRPTPFSYAEQALELAGVSYVNLAFSGEAASSWASNTSGSSNGSGHQLRGRLMEGCTDVWCGYGRNDVSASATLAQMQARVIQTWLTATDRGARAWQSTITPKTSSTDNWVTTANQTLNTSGQNTVRVNFNNWLRDGAPLNPTTLAPATTGTAASSTVVRAGYWVSGVRTVAPTGGPDSTNYPGLGHPLRGGGVVEVADSVESSRDSGLWKPSAMTTDGLHPGDSGHNAMVPAVPTVAFTARP